MSIDNEGHTTWCDVAGVANCDCCKNQRFVRLCPNYPKPPKGLSFRMVEDLQHFGPDWREKPYNVAWPTIEALVKRGVIEKKGVTTTHGYTWRFRRSVAAPAA